MKTLIGIPTLKFDPILELKFKQSVSKNDMAYNRFALLMFSFLYAVFSFTDYMLVPNRFEFFFAIRFYIVIPVLLMTFIATFHPNYPRFKQKIMMMALIVGGTGIATMLVFEPLNTIYYGGLFLVFTAGYFLLNLDFSYAAFGGIAILVLFAAGNLCFGSMSVLASTAFLFLLSENILGCFGAYQLESYRRKEFLSIHNLSLQQIQLNTMVNDKMEEINTAQISTITALANLAESRDHDTGEHIERVGVICKNIAMALPLSYFKEPQEKHEFADTIMLASVLHDIGKIAISDMILNKPGPLNPDEMSIMRTHSEIGRRTLVRLHEQYPNNLFVKLGIEITHYHHERWDGNGYPAGLKNDEIPLSARIVAIVDVYDALISKRPYKTAFSHEKALEIILEEAGTHFDPSLVKIFLEVIT